MVFIYANSSFRSWFRIHSFFYSSTFNSRSPGLGSFILKFNFSCYSTTTTTTTTKGKNTSPKIVLQSTAPHSITQSIQQCQRGQTTPSLLLHQCLDQLHHFNPSCNAFVSLHEKEHLMHQAFCSDQAYQQGQAKPLEGMPFAIKDNVCTQELPTTCGSQLLMDYVSPFNATLISILSSLGAIIVGKTNMDEFGMGSYTFNSFLGPTYQCRSSSTSSSSLLLPGGSSGGSAVAVQSGMAFSAVGSDTGGSIRLPASYCGLVSMKPTYGWMSRHGCIPFAHSLDTLGWFTKDIKDLAYIMLHVTPQLSKVMNPSSSSSSSSSSHLLKSETKKLNQQQLHPMLSSSPTPIPPFHSLNDSTCHPLPKVSSTFQHTFPSFFQSKENQLPFSSPSSSLLPISVNSSTSMNLMEKPKTWAIGILDLSNNDFHSTTTSPPPPSPHQDNNTTTTNRIKSSTTFHSHVHSHHHPVQHILNHLRHTFHSYSNQFQVHSIPFHWLTNAKAMSAYQVISACEAASNLLNYDGIRFGQTDVSLHPRSYLSSTVQRRIVAGTYALSANVTPNYYTRATYVRHQLHQAWRDHFFDHPEHPLDVLLVPTTFSSAPSMSSLFSSSSSFVPPFLTSIEETYHVDALTIVPSLLGLPVITLPFAIQHPSSSSSAQNSSSSTTTSTTTYYGIQCIGKYQHDWDLLAFAQHVWQLFQERQQTESIH